MSNRSMTLGAWFYLKTYCTASGPWPYRKPGKGGKRRTAGVNGAVNSEFAGQVAGLARRCVRACKVVGCSSSGSRLE